MVMKCTAVCLVALAMLGSFCDAQGGGYTAPTYKKPGKNVPLDPQQHKQTFERPLTWKYPEDPKPEPKPEVEIELRQPPAAATVAVECRENIAHVEVKKDMFGTGQFINPADLTLGNCGAVAEDNAVQVLIFESELQNCGSTLMMTEESIIYIFTLNYDPKTVMNAPVVRTNKAAVLVECHYPRKHNVSSLPLDPVWVPFSAIKTAEEFLYFTLKLMTSDWRYERPTYQYFIGDMVNIEASVDVFYHVPLRIYVDNCVGTLTPDIMSEPRYVFIDNHGCFVDPRLTGAVSRFLPRTVENKINLQLEAFRFQNIDNGLLYITCVLKATSVTHAIDNQHRACSYIGGWRESSGMDGVCGSCESPGLPSPGAVTGGAWNPSSGVTNQVGSNPQVGGRKIRDVSNAEVLEWESVVTMGPIPILDRA